MKFGPEDAVERLDMWGSTSAPSLHARYYQNVEGDLRLHHHDSHLTALRALRSKNGDREALAELLDFFKPKAVNFAASRCGNREIAEDAVGEAEKRALDRIGGLKSTSAFWSWYRKIVSNCVSDHFRLRDNTSAVTSIETLPEAFVEFTHEEKCNEFLVLHTLKEELSEKDFDIIYYIDHLGLSYKETAAVIDVPLGTVRSRLHAARQRARAVLSPALPDESAEI